MHCFMTLRSRRSGTHRRHPVRILSVPLALLILGLSSAGCRQEERRLPTIDTQSEFREDGRLAFLEPNGDTLGTIAIEIAETPTALGRGLMGRRSLPSRSGMLFIMEDTDTTGFWMRNTPLPLDIIFVGPDSQVVSIARRTTPYSDESIQPEAPKKFVVEVRAGQAERLGITDSTKIAWERTGTAI